MATSRWEPDGTQPPPPPPLWEDPLAGLVTGVTYEQEPLHVNLVKPVELDLSEVRRAVDAVLSDEDDDLPAVVPAPRRAQPTAPAQTPGMVAPNPRAGWPLSPSSRQVAGLRPRQARQAAAAARARRVRDGRSSPGAGVAGIIAALIVLVVVIVIVIAIINSLADTISNIVN